MWMKGRIVDGRSGPRRVFQQGGSGLNHHAHALRARYGETTHLSLLAHKANALGRVAAEIAARPGMLGDTEIDVRASPPIC